MGEHRPAVGIYLAENRLIEDNLPLANISEEAVGKNTMLGYNYSDRTVRSREL